MSTKLLFFKSGYAVSAAVMGIVRNRGESVSDLNDRDVLSHLAVSFEMSESTINLIVLKIHFCKQICLFQDNDYFYAKDNTQPVLEFFVERASKVLARRHQRRASSQRLPRPVPDCKSFNLLDEMNAGDCRCYISNHHCAATAQGI
eukprot:gene32024-42730_t